MPPLAELEYADAGRLLNSAFTSVNTIVPGKESRLSFREGLNDSGSGGLAVEQLATGRPEVGEISAVVTGPDGRKYPNCRGQSSREKSSVLWVRFAPPTHPVHLRSPLK